MDIADIIAKNIKALKERVGDTYTCPICHHTNFIVINGTFRQDVQTKPDAITMGGPGISSMVLICDHCGFISQHALEILNKVENTDANNKTGTDHKA